MASSGDCGPLAKIAALVEIAENLHRRELGEIEKAELMAKWVEISAERVKAVPKPDDGKPGQSGPVSGKGGRGNKGGINQAARELGVPATQLKRAVRVASLSPEAKAAGRAAPQAVLLEAAKEESPAAAGDAGATGGEPLPPSRTVGGRAAAAP